MATRQGRLASAKETLAHPSTLVDGFKPTYQTNLGAAFSGDSLELMRSLPSGSVQLIVTSPPYALHFQKEYGNVAKHDYVRWFMPFGREMHRILAEDGSLVLNIGGSYNAGEPTRSLYHMRLLIDLCDTVGFKLAQELFWYNPAKLPAPAEWVNVRRIRVKDSVEYLWWLSPSAWPAADNREVLVPYSKDMERIIERGYEATQRPSGHNITPKFRRRNGGAIPSNVIERGNNDSNSEFMRASKERGIQHPARFPAAIPEFFVKFLTQSDDLVLDPFAGSNTTGHVAESLDRRWLAFEIIDDYVRASALRFGMDLFAE
ncbi:MAG: site-specific DNA-methyltransferase [Chloroflexi bacterium]|nr:site-specific DNA-methyltransferase [Chloroflexota bacterium]